MKPENVACPTCGGPMVSRINRQKNSRFWGCKDFPRCRGTRDVDGLSASDRYRQTAEAIGSDEYEPEDDDHPGNPRFYGDH